MKDKGRILGLDLGSRRIGVAVTDSDQRVATGVQVVNRGDDRQADHRAVAALVVEYEAVGLVVGLPISMSGQTGPSARAVLEEVDEIRSRVAVDIDTVDERLTTVAASGALRAAGRPARRQKTLIDQTAAAVILQTWVDRRRA
jgi:putative Holliday junction resolvase